MRHLLLILVGLIVASGAGYFIGYDHGFKKGAVPIPVSVETNAVSDAAMVMSQIVGMWQSTDDPKFTREIRNDGVVIDSYAGGEDADSDGLWMVFTKEVPDEAFTGVFEPNVAYLSMGMSETEKLYFKILRVDDESLQLLYLDRGNLLSFVRIP
ncbi:MAG: hypothetical protein WAZ27_00100 [Minisyncoccia bacterium]